MKKLSRKKFLKKAALGTLGTSLVANACTSDENIADNAPNIINNKKYKWKMVTTWPPNLPILSTGPKQFAEMVNTMSEGRLEIKVYAGGELVPPLEAFEAVSSGAAEMGAGGAYYWAGRAPSTVFFSAIPFGMNTQQMNSWMISGDGLKLWRELYDRFNLIPFLGGGTGVQMAGWFNKEINTIDDFKGLKMRMPGMGGKVLAKAGGTAVLSAGSEIYTNLERGVIDATEWIGPYHDYLMGFHQIAKYYYYPGWHEPGTMLEFFVNKRDYNALPTSLQQIVETASYRIHTWTIAQFDAMNNTYINKIKTDSDVQIKPLPDQVIAELKRYAHEVVQEQVASDEFSKKTNESYQKFSKDVSAWSNLSERPYYEKLMGS